MADDLKAVVERLERVAERPSQPGGILRVKKSDLRALLSALRKKDEALEPLAEAASIRERLSTRTLSDETRASTRLGNLRAARAALTGSREHG